MNHLLEILKQYWGYDGFRPFQVETIQSIVAGRDSLTVLPTGGGKSLCYQLPSLLYEGKTAIVLSPLIALMKDQVDSARSLGIAADTYNSSLSSEEQRAVWSRFSQGETRLLYISPERLAVPEFIETLRTSDQLSFFAIDEAHCISQWGHDFRTDYRMLSRLKEFFPHVGVHAFTATATPQVKTDILQSLNLINPDVLIGDYDRPNLYYQAKLRPSQREKFLADLMALIGRRRGEAGIIYCISRAEVDQLAADLKRNGFSALPYHAGLSDNTRRDNQEAFMSESVDIMVATVAFGMGIDRSNIRFVVHTGMPKSLEHYQQEAGRAGRDGLASDCILFHGGRDTALWSEIIRQGSPDVRSVSYGKLDDMSAYCHSVLCRHRFLVEYFGQTYAKGVCGTCDVCQEPQEIFKDSLEVARKILSCVWRVGQRQNTTYISRVLSGSADARILENAHDQLSTYGLLKEYGRKDAKLWVEQLVSQRYLERRGQFGDLALTPSGTRLLKEGLPETVMLSNPMPKTKKVTSKQKYGPVGYGAQGYSGQNYSGQAYSGDAPQGQPPSRPAKRDRNDWDGVDKDLFETLRTLRRTLATAQDVPAFIVFSDVTLRDMARMKPTNEKALLQVQGVGYKKFEQYGDAFLEEIRNYVNIHGTGDAPSTSQPSQYSASDYEEGEAEGRPVKKRQTSSRPEIFECLKQGVPLPDIAQQVGVKPSTVSKYLVEYIREYKITDASAWVEDTTFRKVADLVTSQGFLRWKGMFEALEGTVSYEDIHVCVEVLKNRIFACTAP